MFTDYLPPNGDLAGQFKISCMLPFYWASMTALLEYLDLEYRNKTILLPFAIILMIFCTVPLFLEIT